MITHDGNRLRYFFDKHTGKTKDVLEKLGFKDYTALYYYFNREEIKRSVLQKFCEALGITTDEFYNNVKKVDNYSINTLHEDTSTLYTQSKHQGKNLLSILENRGITKTHFARQLNISRPTLDSYFEEKELPLHVLLEVAHVLQTPVANIKGIGTGEKSFEKDIYLLLQEINNKLDKLLPA